MKNLSSTIGILQRLKSSVPFSTTLNAYINNKYAELVGTYHLEVVLSDKDKYFDMAGGDPERAFCYMLEDFNAGKLVIWTGESENTIFGDPWINYQFRAIHDIFHCVYQKGFSAGDELQVNYLQQQAFCFDGLGEFDRELLNIETAGQVLYFDACGEFPKDQRKFAIGELVKTYNYRAEFRDPKHLGEIEGLLNGY